jgi:7,8-dihydropterin-6-yl-methyl-4-(beta-D-ribofuranosyl)aminobenzene 5'-phosphate synthase
MSEIFLRDADKVQITVLVDNYTDLVLLQSTDSVKRPQVRPPAALLAEHGFSCFISVFSGPERHDVLLDAGVTTKTLFHNADVLNVNLGDVETVILSHGHFDHFGGLLAFFKETGKQISLVLHPDAFLERRLNIVPLGLEVDLPTLSEEDLKTAGALVQKHDGEVTLASDLILVSGEVKRRTEFEKGLPWAEAKIGTQWVHDPIRDDQGLCIKVRDKGLVVIGGCSHAGIINTVRHLQEKTGVEKVHAVLGGFHLTGPIFEPIIGPTIEEMKKIGPNFVVPAHCTGWNAMNRFAEAMPEQFVLNTVGTTYVF